MKKVVIGKGNLLGKGVYAANNFRKGEIVIQYHLKSITNEEYKDLFKDEKLFVHTHFGKKYLYSEPERYVNHSENPNTYQDLEKQQDIARKDIIKGEMITTDAEKDNV